VTDLMWLWLLGCALIVAFYWCGAAPARRRQRRMSKWSEPMRYAGKRGGRS